MFKGAFLLLAGGIIGSVIGVLAGSILGFFGGAIFANVMNEKDEETPVQDEVVYKGATQ